MKKQTKGRAAAIVVMLLCIAVSIPLGMHTSLDYKDNQALDTFYEGVSGETSAMDVLTANNQVGENLVRSAQVIASDFSESEHGDALQSQLETLKTAYLDFSEEADKSSKSRSRTEKLIETYNTFSDAAFAWIDLADTAIQSQSGDYQTYTTFRDKFTQNHDRLVGGAYNREAALYNETFDEPLVQALQPISFTEPLVTFREQEVWS